MLAPDVMRHRAAVNYEAEAGNISSEDNIQKIPETLTVLRSGINLGKGESIMNPESRLFCGQVVGLSLVHRRVIPHSEAVPSGAIFWLAHAGQSK